jgi:hypothetical protein
MAYQMDFFAASSEAKVLAAIQNSVVQYPAYVFIRNEDGTTGRLGFVDQNNVFKYIVGGESKQQVVNVVELPTEGELDVIYICNGVAYIFDGTDFVEIGSDKSDVDLEALIGRIEALETSNIEAAGKIADLITELETVTEQVTKLEDKIVEVEKATLTFVELE